MELLVVWIVVAIVGAIVAGNKGRSGVGWFFICLLLTPLAVLILLALPTLKSPEPQAALVTVVSAPPTSVEADQARSPCPFCAEMILDAAVVCRFCGRDLPVNWGHTKADPSPQIGSTPGPMITCPQCSCLVLRGTRTCPDCGTRIPFFA
jgi:hypothetical protein